MTTLPYGPLLQLAEGIHVLDGRWRRSPMQRRMTVIEGGDGEVALHSAIALGDADHGLIDGLGRVSLILVPNSLHHSDAGFYAERYPDAQVLVPAQVEPAMRQALPRVDGLLDDGLPWGDELAVFPIHGTRVGEVWFFHRPSRTLITTDLVFHYQAGDFKGIARLFMRLNGALDHFGPTRLARLWFIRDHEAFRKSIAPVLELDVERVVMSHGRLVTDQGKAKLAEAFRRWAPA